jgi:hypothetical protein
MVQQSPKLVLLLTGAAMLGLAGAVLADDRGGSTGQGTVIMSRGADAAHADLMRDWGYKGVDQGRRINLRTSPELNADLMREWGGPAKGTEAQTRQAPHSRATDAAYDDLMRNWGG